MYNIISVRVYLILLWDFMNTRSAKGYIKFSFSLFITFLTCVIIAVGVALFHSQYFANKIIEYKSSEISQEFNNSDSLSLTARNMLHKRDDISYLNIFNEEGVLQENFSIGDAVGTKEVVLKLFDGQFIGLGLRDDVVPLVDSYALSWSLIIGIISAIILLFIISIRDSKETKPLKEFEKAMESISQGDYTVRLGGSFLGQDGKKDYNSTYMIFNKMARNLYVKYRKRNISYVPSMDVPLELKENNDLDNGVSDSNSELEYKLEDEPEDTSAGLIDQEFLSDEGNKDEGSEVKVKLETSDISTEQDNNNKGGVMDQVEKTEDDLDGQEIQEVRKEPETSVEETVRRSFFVSAVAKSHEARSDLRHVSVLVVITEGLDNLLCEEYMQSFSEMVVSYGGRIDHSSQSGFVAVFDPSDDNYPCMRPICAAVEILTKLADTAIRSKSENMKTVTGKVGISTKSLSGVLQSGVLQSGVLQSDVSDSLEDLIEDAKQICEITQTWKLSISSELYEEVKDFVEARKYTVDGKDIYSVKGVEHGVVRPEGRPEKTDM